MALPLGITGTTAFRNDAWISRIDYGTDVTPFNSSSDAIWEDMMVKTGSPGSDGYFVTGLANSSVFSIWVAKYNFNGELLWAYYHTDSSQGGGRPIRGIQEQGNTNEFVGAMHLDVDDGAGGTRAEHVLLFGNLELGPQNSARSFSYNNDRVFATDIATVANQPSNLVFIAHRPQDPSVDTASTFVDYISKYETSPAPGVLNSVWDDQCGNVQDLIGTKDYLYQWSIASANNSNIPNISSRQQVICTQLDPSDLSKVNRVVIENSDPNNFETLVDYVTHDPSSNTFVCSFNSWNAALSNNSIWLQEYQNVDSTSPITETGFEASVYPTVGSTSDSSTSFRTFALKKQNSNIYLAFNYWGINLDSLERRTVFLMRIANNYSNFKVFKFVFSGTSRVDTRGMEIANNKILFNVAYDDHHYMLCIDSDMPSALYGTTYGLGDMTVTISNGSSEVDYNASPGNIRIGGTETSGFTDNSSSGLFVDRPYSFNWQQYNVSADTDYLPN